MITKYTYGLISLICYSLFGLLAKDLYKYNINEYVMFFYTSLFSLIYFFVSSLIQNNFSINKVMKINKHDLMLSLFNVGFLGTFICGIASIISVKYIDTGIQRAIVFSSAVYIIIIEAIFYKRKLKLSTIIYSLCLIVGLLLIAGNINFGNNITNIITGIFMAFISAFTYAIYSMIAEKHTTKAKNTTVWIYAYILSAILTLIVIALDNKLGNLNIFDNFSILVKVMLLAVVCVGLSEYFMLKSIQVIGSVKTNIVSALVPPTTFIIGFLFLGERMTFIQFVGFVMLVISSIKIK